MNLDYFEVEVLREMEIYRNEMINYFEIQLNKHL